MMKDYYELLGISKNATDYEIYCSFTKLMLGYNSYDEKTKKKYINAFIVLSDINLRIKYDLSLGLNYYEEMPWYHYTYFENGDNFFDINGFLNGNKELTKTIETIKGNQIRSSVSKDAFFSEHDLLVELSNYTKKRIENKDYETYMSEQKDCKNLSDEEKFNYFQKIYEIYKREFSFSNAFAKIISSQDYYSMKIEDATKINAQQLLISKKGVCTHFASLIYEELKGLGLEAYFLRMTLPNWFHHVVLYRVNKNWNICDLTNEYLFGNAGYKNISNSYISIPLKEFLKNNEQALDNCIILKLAKDTLLEEDSLRLMDFLESRLNLDLQYENKK